MRNFIYPISNNFNGVCIIVHGLNVTPKIMYEIAFEFLKKDIIVNLVTLRGHDSFNSNSFEDFLSVTPDILIEDLSKAFSVVDKEHGDLPIHFVGYSLGGLVGVNYLLHYNESKVTKMHLFAPALSIVWYTKLLKIVKVFKYINVSIPGKTPKQYRAHNLTPLQAFYSIGVLIDRLNIFKEKIFVLNRIKTNVYFHPKDELVSTKGLERFISSNNLTNWNMIKCDYKTNFKHLFIAKKELSDIDFKKFKLVVAKNIN